MRQYGAGVTVDRLPGYSIDFYPKYVVQLHGKLLGTIEGYNAYIRHGDQQRGCKTRLFRVRPTVLLGNGFWEGLRTLKEAVDLLVRESGENGATNG